MPVLSAGAAGREGYAEPYDFDRVCALAEGKSVVPGAKHVREGVVVRPVKERQHRNTGRVVLKWVGVGYLDRKVAEDPTPDPDDEIGTGLGAIEE